MIPLGARVFVIFGGHAFNAKTCEVIDRFEDPRLDKIGEMVVVRDSEGYAVVMPESRLRVLRAVSEEAAE